MPRILCDSMQAFADFIPDFHKQLQKSLYQSAIPDSTIRKVLDQQMFGLLDRFLGGVVYVLDYRKMQYVYVSSSCEEVTGYKPQQVLDGGLAFVMNKIHPEDVQHFTSRWGKKYLDIIRGMDDSELHLYRFTYNFRFQKSTGQFVQMLTQAKMALRDEQGNPVLSVGYFTDFEQYKKDDIMRMQVQKFNQRTGKYIEIDLISENDLSSPLTYREREILEFIAAGKQNKAISARLDLSIYTVRAHRRNILRKLGCSNFANATVKAKQQGWI